MDLIKAAIANLRLQDKPNIIATAKKHGCNRITLFKRFRNVTGSKAAAHDLIRLLN
jgi:transposase-like protein